MSTAYRDWLRDVTRKRARVQLSYGDIVTFPYLEGKRNDGYPLLMVTNTDKQNITGINLLLTPNKELFLTFADEILKAKSLRQRATFVSKIKRDKKMRDVEKTYSFDVIKHMSFVSEKELERLRDIVIG